MLRAAPSAPLSNSTRTRAHTSSTLICCASTILSASVAQPAGKLARLEPHRARFRIGAIVGAGEARKPAVAADLEVVLREQRQLLVEPEPLAALAEFLQPVGAQALGDIGPGLALEKARTSASGASSMRSFRRQYSR